MKISRTIQFENQTSTSTTNLSINDFLIVSTFSRLRSSEVEEMAEVKKRIGFVGTISTIISKKKDLKFSRKNIFRVKLRVLKIFAARELLCKYFGCFCSKPYENNSSFACGIKFQQRLFNKFSFSLKFFLFSLYWNWWLDKSYIVSLKSM